MKYNINLILLCSIYFYKHVITFRMNTFYKVLEIFHGLMEIYGHKNIRSRVFLHELDILSQDSIQSLKNRIQENYGGMITSLIKKLRIFVSTNNTEQ